MPSFKGKFRYWCCFLAPATFLACSPASSFSLDQDSNSCPRTSNRIRTNFSDNFLIAGWSKIISNELVIVSLYIGVLHCWEAKSCRGASKKGGKRMNLNIQFKRKIQILMLVPGACHLSRSLPCIFLPLNDAELRSVKRQWPTPLRWFLIGQRSNRSTSYDSSRKSIWPRVQSGPPMLSHFDSLWNNFQY